MDWLDITAGLSVAASDYNYEQWWKLIQAHNEEDRALGVTDINGIMHYGDHKTADVSQTVSFQKALLGETCIALVEDQWNEGGDFIRVSYPIRLEDGTVDGMVSMRYGTLKFGSKINHDDFKVHGINLIIDDQGRFAASHDGLENFDTFYDLMQTMTFEQADAVSKMHEDIINGKSGIVYYKNKGAQRLLCYQPTEVYGWTMVSVASVNSYEEILQYIKDLSAFYVIIQSLLYLGFGWLAVTIMYRGKKDQKRVQTDGLTGVYTRDAGKRKVMRRLRKNQDVYACLFMDVDDFKKFNDEKGHDNGDEALRQLGTALKKAVRAQDIVFRFGGDEFCVWLVGHGEDAEIKAVAGRIKDEVENCRILLHVSMGATIVRKDESDFDEILKRADEALYEAKRNGKNKIVIKE